MSIDTRKYVAMDGSPTLGATSQFFTDIGPAYVENNNLWGGVNIFTQPIIVAPGLNNNQAVTVAQLSDAIATVETGYASQPWVEAQLLNYAPLAGATFSGPVILS